MTRTFRHTCLCILVTGTAALAQQPAANGLAGLLGSYPDLAKVTARRFVEDASRAGLIQGTADSIRAKHMLRALHQKKGDRRGRRFGGSRPDHAIPGSTREKDANVDEVEYNDSPGWANVLGSGSNTARGRLSSFDDVDAYQFVMDRPGLLTAIVDPAGASPVEDPSLAITSAAGSLIAFSDDSGGTLYPRIDTFLPAGTYWLSTQIVGGNVGDYSLSVSRTRQEPTLCPTNTTVNGNLPGPNGAFYWFNLTRDSTVDITFNGGSLDLAFLLFLPNGALYSFQDDSATGLDPRLDSALPAGLYFMQVIEFSGSPGAFSFRIDATPGVAAAPCGSTATGTIAGQESLRLWRLALPTAQTVRFSTSPSGTTPIDDTVLALLDRNLNTVAFNDDIDPSLFSALEVPLPAGTYWVGVAGFIGSAGDFALSATCGLPVAITAASPGGNPGSVGTSGGTAAFTIEVCTPNAWDFRVDTGTGTLGDPVLSVLDSKGRVVVFNDDSPFSLDSAGGNRLAADTHWVLVRDFSDGTGSFTLNAEPPLWYRPSGSSRAAAGHGWAGDLTFLLGSLVTVPPVQILPPGMGSGYLLIDLNTSVEVGSQTIPADGRYAWPAVPVGFGGVLQGITFAGGGFPASFSEVLK